MKKVCILLVTILFAVTGVTAQTPEMFKYQAVLRNADGTIMADKSVTVDISILQGSASGSEIFAESHSVTTTAQGIINLNIGSIADLCVVDWSADIYFIEITVDGTVMGTSQLLSVPYAIHANTVENDQVDDADADATNELQNLSEVLTENNDAGAMQIKNIADPTDDQDAATKAYVDYKFDLLSSLITGVTDYDGNHYSAVLIGNQIWMAENLKVTHYPNGDEILYIVDNTQWKNLADNNDDDAYCYYDDNPNSYSGALYTYAAAINGDNSENDVQGVCPDGWHLPSRSEWVELENYLGTDLAGGKLKECGTAHWSSPNTGATNESGFIGLPGGFRTAYDGYSTNESFTGHFWTATESGGNGAYNCLIFYNHTYISMYGNFKSSGNSVRCIKNSPVDKNK